MAILKIEEYENSGIVKEFAEGAEDLIFKNVQTEYQFPIKSFIRETFSNAIDSIKEREAARDIIVNKSPISKYFINRTGILVNDSNFTPDYYDFDYLSTKKSVDILYTHVPNAQRDVITITDEGVGLGGKRLRGFMKIGYSSKRNSAFTLGKFGIGAKAGLATNVEYFQVTTRYNGKETSFLVYLKNYICTIPEYEATKTEIWKVKKQVGNEIIEVDEPIYWKDTNQPNGVTVTLEVRKTNADKYREAVRDQLLYFQDYVNFSIVTDGGIPEKIDLTQQILFETDNCIVSNYNQFNKPHLIVEGMNYGIIYFSELDLDDKSGRIGLKVGASSITVNQQRETVKWDDLTKKTILNKVELVTQDVTNYLSAKLKIDSLLDWLVAASTILHKSSDPIVEAMSGFIDKSKLELSKDITKEWTQLSKGTQEVIPKILRASPLTFHNIFANYKVLLVEKNVKTPQSISSFASMPDAVFILGEEGTVLTQKLKAFILFQEEINTFIYLRKINVANYETKIHPKTEVNFAQSLEFFEVLLTGHINSLDDYIPTEAFDKIYKDSNSENAVDEETEDLVEAEVLYSAAERRKLENKVFFKEFSEHSYYSNLPEAVSWSEAEIVIKDIYDNNMNQAATVPVIYGNQKHKQLLEVVYMMHVYSSKNQMKVIRVSELNNKYFNKHIHVEMYLKTIGMKGGFTLGTALKDYNTVARLRKIINDNAIMGIVIQLRKTLPEYTEFLNSNEELINKAIKLPSSDYKKNIFDSYSRWDNSALVDQLLDFMDNATEVNILSAQGEETLAVAKCKEYFGSDKFIEIDAIDYEIITIFKEIADTIQPITALLNNLDLPLRDEAAKLLVILRKTLIN